ncbi:hypothetical protein FVR03_09145 [Pontibacter qinzhouensis]|uniref:Uncharacterized protein n=1 Tax=Pontibacter qinzhouensis TaxID=2603253 RepID=A0A5C8KAX8_9BACT|nr:hypothetical protein [Pontibacter qinzhouensis]TXK47548.1 hypothetical protein FVR03_09145 [Pontibacter qinzhouensis]
MAKNAHYSGVRPEVYNQLRDKLQTMGLHLEGNSGNIKEKGVSASYLYNPEAESLEINDVSVGFPASMMLNADSLIERMNQMIVQYGGQPKI